MNKAELIDFLNCKAEQYNSPLFIESDPIQLPHRFTKKEDIEIVSFLVSTIAWRNRTSIIKSGERILALMQNDPHEFILNYDTESAIKIEFVHRTFNAYDLDFFFRSLNHLYKNKGGLENAFEPHPTIFGSQGRISNFRKAFLETEHENRSQKHISNPNKNSAAKRLNIFTRVISVVENKLKFNSIFAKYTMQY